MDSDLRREVQEISAEGITKTEFPVRVRGYDRDEVDAFLAVVADEMRRLTAASEELAAKSEQPFKALGSEAGKLLQMARAAADRTSQEAQADASITRDRAADELAEAEDEVTRMRSEAKREAAQSIQATKAEAERLRKEAQRLRSEAEAESVRLKQSAEAAAKQAQTEVRAEHAVLMREAQREGERIKKEARAHADQLRESAEEEALEKVRKARAEVRRLLEAEAALKQRVAGLTRDKERLTRDVEEVRAQADSYLSLSQRPTSDSEAGA
jgi:DivIVA domain-containing protein